MDRRAEGSDMNTWAISALNRDEPDDGPVVLDDLSDQEVDAMLREVLAAEADRLAAGTDSQREPDVPPPGPRRSGPLKFSPQRLALADRLGRACGLQRSPTSAVRPRPDTGAEATAAPDLMAEARLDPAITVPAGHRRRSDLEPRQILLTGATGFLGAFLLAEMLRAYPGARVLCLVRAARSGDAAERLERNLRRYGVWDEAMWERVGSVSGDLERPSFGLTRSQFGQLAEQVDLVFHNGARVHLVEPYARMRATNVLGTQEVLRLAAPAAVPVHFVSTNGVLFGRSDNPDVLREDRRLAPDMVPPNGYVQTKWVAEALVRQARHRGIPTAIYRPSWISGETGSGACAALDALWSFVKACVELQGAPDGEGWDVREDLVPVDYVAGAIVHLARHREPDGAVYCLTNPVPTPAAAVLERIRAAGYPMASMAMGQWGERLAALAATAGPGSCLPAVAVLLGDLSALREHSAVRVRYDDANTRRGLAGSGIACPAVGADPLDRCVRYLRDTGFLPALETGRGVR
jgi:thioester reductase-like protein